MTIEDVSLTIPETKVTAIVGASGKWKNHLAETVAGVLSCNEGRNKNRRSQPEQLQPEMVAQTVRGSNARRSDIL